MNTEGRHAELLSTLRMLIERTRRRGMCLDCGAQLDDYLAHHECAVDRTQEIITGSLPWMYQGEGTSPKTRAKGYAVR